MLSETTFISEKDVHCTLKLVYQDKFFTHRNGASELYGGLTGELLVQDIKMAGGIITLKVNIIIISKFSFFNLSNMATIYMKIGFFFGLLFVIE